MAGRWLGLWACVMWVGCASSPEEAPPTPDGGQGQTLVQQRPYRLVVPSSYRAEVPAPLVILLHGFGSTGAEHDTYFGFSPLAEARGFLLATPDGTLGVGNRRFWDATDACCNFFAPPVDDVAYLRAVISDVQSRYAVDSRRIFVTGHSNGGFMSYRMGCEAADLVAGVASLAGATWKDPARCQPAAGVAVLQAHGTTDTTIRYEGGAVTEGAPPYPSARETVERWAEKNRCTGALALTEERLDLDTAVPGTETTVARTSACGSGAAELWTLEGSSHVPQLGPEWAPRVYEFLLAHPKP